MTAFLDPEFVLVTAGGRMDFPCLLLIPITHLTLLEITLRDILSPKINVVSLLK
jgi:hypothetical protein